MKLEEQVTSLEISKRLKELGIDQQSLFYWHNIDSIPSIICNHWYPERSGDFFISAFTTSELLEMLPHHLVSHEEEPFNSYRLHVTGSVIVKNPECIDPIRTHIVNYECDTHRGDALILDRKYLTKNIWDENPADALAKMLIFLVENKLIENENAESIS